ncbi:MAG: hypothetical protein HGA49_12985 [Eubacteriaceae bacterium]|nr:hypothetical protein [Eubacteriaceae bacterium]
MDKKAFIYSIVTSIVATIIFSLFLAPVSLWLWDLTKNGAYQWMNSLQNHAFINAALGKRDWVGPMSFILIYVFFASAVISSPIGYLIGSLLRKQLYHKAKSEGMKSMDKAILKNVFHLARFSVYVCALYSIYLFGQQSFLVYTDMQMNTSFEQRINAIRPYISEQDTHLLRSKWALMKNRSDYENIQREIELKATIANIDLPELLYK